MSEMFTKCNGFIVSGDPLVYADSATMTGQGTVSEPFGVKSTDLFVQEPLYTGTSGNSAYIGWNNETVLWSGAASSTAQIVLSQPFSGFDKVDVYWRSYGRRFVTTLDGQSQFAVGAVFCDNNIPQATTLLYDGAPNGTTMSWSKSFHQPLTATSNTSVNPNSNIYVFKIVGINRKE